MEIRPAIQIQSMIKAMTDVVLPAVDPEHKMAQEQARLVIGMLNLLAQRLPFQFRYDCDELKRYVTLAGQLQEQVHGADKTRAATETMNACLSKGAAVLDRARAEPGEVEAAVFDLRAAVSALVQAGAEEGDPSSRAALKQLILGAAKIQLDRERAWLISMGFEADPSVVPPIESLIGAGPRAAHG